MGLAFVVAVVCALCQVNDAFDRALSVLLGRRRPSFIVFFGRKVKKSRSCLKLTLPLPLGLSKPWIFFSPLP